MHAVIGVWDLDPSAREAQDKALSRIVEGVGQLTGLVKGYWADVEGTSRSYTIIVFEDREPAIAFAASVEANLEQQLRHGVHNVSLGIVTVKATT